MYQGRLRREWSEMEKLRKSVAASSTHSRDPKWRPGIEKAEIHEQEQQDKQNQNTYSHAGIL